VRSNLQNKRCFINIPLTNDIASKYGMTKESMIKYLLLFDRDELRTDSVLKFPQKDECLEINLINLRKVKEELINMKQLHEQF